MATTISQVFQQKKLWAWFDSPVTNPFDGVHEKGEDYSTAFGTPVAVPVGGTIVRIVHNNNSIGDVVELQASNGGVWLYQHITAKVKVGDVLQCASVIGTENGLPIDQYSTGPHIEVRYCNPGSWKPNIDSWLEPWVNPRAIFSGIGSQPPGSVAQSPGPAISASVKGLIGPNADVTMLLVVLDETLALKNPFDTQNVPQDSFAGASFTDPVAWTEQVGTNFMDDLSAVTMRLIFLSIGLYIIYKVLNTFIDFGAIVQTGVKGVETAASLGVMLA